RGLLGRSDELVADLDLDLAEVAGLAGVGVADRALTALDRGDQTRGAVSGLAALDRPRLDDAAAPGALGGGRQVVGEVLRRARVVRAVHGRDLGVGQVGVRVEV